MSRAKNMSERAMNKGILDRINGNFTKLCIEHSEPFSNFLRSAKMNVASILPDDYEKFHVQNCSENKVNECR